MYKRITYRLFINLVPESFMFVGSLLLGFSLKLVNTETLWEQEGVVNGGVSMGGLTVNIPVQNDPLFWWGLIIFLIGSGLELIKIVTSTIRDELEEIEAEKASKSSTEAPLVMDEDDANLAEEPVPVMVESDEDSEQD